MPRPRTTTVRDLRRSNRSRALWQVFLNGPLTRQEVGTLAGVSPATVSNLVAALEAEGIVAEVGLEDSNGGRPRGLLQVNPNYGYVIGVDVGETAFLVELFDFGLHMCARHTSVTDMTVLDPEDAVSHIVEGIESVIAESGVDPARHPRRRRRRPRPGRASRGRGRARSERRLGRRPAGGHAARQTGPADPG